MIHRIELSASDSALVARGCPLRIASLQAGVRDEFVVVMTRKSWDQIRVTYPSFVRVTLGGS